MRPKCITAARGERRGLALGERARLHGAAHGLLGELRRAELDEAEDVAAQEAAAADGEARGVACEQVRAVEHAQAGVALGVERHRGDDADAELELDVGLDDVGVERRHGDLGREAGAGERVVDARAPVRPSS